MKTPNILLGFFLALTACLARLAFADSWAPPSTEVTASANGQYRVTVVPRGVRSPLAYFEDKVKGREPAGQRKGDAQTSPLARVERRDGPTRWSLLWQKPLVNETAPTSVLLSNDGSYLVTFDNWHSAGYGDDVVVIYDRHGNLVRKLSLEQILPPAYVNQLPRSVSSRWWGGDHRLLGTDQLELQIVEPGERIGGDNTKTVRLRLRLADGTTIPPTGAAWARALARATQLEAVRFAAWQKVRQERISPLPAPTSNDTHAWRHYLFEIRARITSEDESMSGMVLAAPGQERGYHDADSILDWIAAYESKSTYSDRQLIVSSPTTGRLASIMSKELGSYRAGSMKGARIVFIGTLAEGGMLKQAARESGAEVTVIDRSKPFPPGKALPQSPPPSWVDMSARF